MTEWEDIIDDAFEKSTLEDGDFGDYMDDAFEEITMLEEE
jgi:hypothetical protein